MELEWQDCNRQKSEYIISQRGRAWRQEIRVCWGKSLWFYSSRGWGRGISLRSQLLAQVLMFLRWNSGQALSVSCFFVCFVLFLCSKHWQVETRKGEVGGCQVLTIAGKGMWLGPKLLMFECCQSSFPIHLQTQEKSDFSIPFLPFLHLSRKCPH